MNEPRLDLDALDPHRRERADRIAAAVTAQIAMLPVPAMDATVPLRTAARTALTGSLLAAGIAAAVLVRPPASGSGTQVAPGTLVGLPSPMNELLSASEIPAPDALLLLLQQLPERTP